MHHRMSKIIGKVVAMALFAALAGSMPAAAAGARAAAGDADVPPNALGYLLDDGVFSRIDFPGPDLETVGYGINNRGQVAGGYVDVGGTAHGFLY